MNCSPTLANILRAHTTTGTLIWRRVQNTYALQSRSSTIRSRFFSGTTVRPKSSSASTGGGSSASASTAAGARANASSSENGNKRLPSPATLLVTWINRGMYVLGGGALAAAAVFYGTDPSGAHAKVRSMYNDVQSTIKYYKDPSREKLLPDSDVPYPGAPAPRTLVLDLDETLIHRSWSRGTGYRIAKRPGTEAFLAYLCNFYELVVFTSKLPHYVDPILAGLDSNGYVMHRLYRPETKFEAGVYVKDLNALNRDLSRVIVIDHDMQTMKYHRENAIQVPKWTGDPSDTTLLDLVPFLESLSKEDVVDVREHLAIFKERSIKDAVAMHKSMAPQRLEKAQEKQSFFFAGQPLPPPPPTARDENDENSNEMLGKVSSRLFRSSSNIDVPEEVKELKKRV